MSHFFIATYEILIRFRVMAEETQDSSRVKTIMFYGWKYSHYFKVIEEGDKNLWAHCTLCPPCKKPLLSTLNTISNFKKHWELCINRQNWLQKNQASQLQNRGEW